MGKNGIEKFILKSLRPGRWLFLILNSLKKYQNRKFSERNRTHCDYLGQDCVQQVSYVQLKFSFSEKVTKNCGILPHGFDILLVNVKTMRNIAQIFVAFSEKLNFTIMTSVLEYQSWVYKIRTLFLKRLRNFWIFWNEEMQTGWLTIPNNSYGFWAELAHTVLLWIIIWGH